MRSRRGFLKLTATGSMAALLAACGSPDSRFYHLPEPVPQAAPTTDGPIVFIDPATIAEYADRPEFVTRVDGLRLTFEEFDVWGQPVATLITRYMVDAVGNSFGRANVMETPAGAPFEPDFRVAIDFRRLEANDQNEAVIDAQWQIFEKDNLEFAKLGRARLSGVIGAGRPEDAPDPVEPQDLRVKAIANLLDQLAAEISNDIVPGSAVVPPPPTDEQSADAEAATPAQ